MLDEHISFDSSWLYLKASLIWKEKTINSVNWSDTTNPQLDGPVMLAALLYGILGNLLFAYDLANVIILSIILFVMDRTLTIVDVDRVSRLLALNIIICPYLINGFDVNNDLGYFSDLLSGAAYYSIRVLTILLIIYTFTNRRGRK